MDLADPSGTELEGFFVTIDPERDDPEILNSYVTYFSDRITGITGEPDKVWALADSGRSPMKSAITVTTQPMDMISITQPVCSWWTPRVIFAERLAMVLRTILPSVSLGICSDIR